MIDVGCVEDSFPDPEGMMSMSMSMSGPGDPCIDWFTNFSSFYYFGDQLFSEYYYDSSLSLSGNFVYLGGERVAKISNNDNTVRNYLNDHLESVVAMVKPDGDLRNVHQHEPYGKLHRSVAYDEFDFGFTAHVIDEELDEDIYYCGARYYYPKYRIFTSIDPLKDMSPGWGPYVYALSNPVKYVDPDGQAVETVVDVVSIGLSAKDMWDNPSWGNAGWLLLDIGAAAVPFLPAVGVVRHAGKIDDLIDAIKGGENATDVGKSTKAAKEGIYDAKSTSGKPYVGQSKDLDSRLDRQVKVGKISPEEAAKANLKEVPGGKTAREIAEQKRINELGGIKNLENKRNPIGERRKQLLNEPQP